MECRIFAHFDRSGQRSFGESHGGFSARNKRVYKNRRHHPGARAPDPHAEFRILPAVNDAASRRNVLLAVVLAALGYFVDIYDLILFSIVRVPSLKGIGVADAELLNTGVALLNWQMGGMLIGGVLWGILGDKKGRLSVLFGSIAVYSAANIANGFVHTLPAYAALRFIAGVGLAGELGAGITLVCELMPKDTRGYGTMAVAGVGIVGGVAAGLVGDFFTWRTAYFVGGGLGLLLLTLRVGVYESGLFDKLSRSTARRGDFLMLFSSWKILWKYACCILLGVPVWFVIGILATFAPEFGKALGMPVLPTGGHAVMWLYAGCALGDFASGGLSQWLRSRRWAASAFVAATALLSAVYLNSFGSSLAHFYSLCFGLGFFSGYWAVFVTIASEQFGTNIRATVTTTVPNFVRGSLVAVSWAFTALKPGHGILRAAGIVGTACFALAFLSLTGLRETFGKDLDYLEPHV
ncbi:MAG: MFS transporter [Elusimicrobia bacterium]|nr:MFS transporter [Elusimicrobiota bacterium]